MCAESRSVSPRWSSGDSSAMPISARPANQDACCQRHVEAAPLQDAHRPHVEDRGQAKQVDRGEVHRSPIIAAARRRDRCSAGLRSSPAPAVSDADDHEPEQEHQHRRERQQVDEHMAACAANGGRTRSLVRLRQQPQAEGREADHHREHPVLRLGGGAAPLVERQRPVVRRGSGRRRGPATSTPTWTYQICVRVDHAVVDRLPGGAEQVRSLAERVGGQVHDRLPVVGEEREVVRDHVDGRDRDERVHVGARDRA